MFTTTSIAKLNNDKINFWFYFTLYNNFVVYIYYKKDASSIMLFPMTTVEKCIFITIVY